MRDGLKPVQRRILYTMWQQNLTADAKHRKCAKVVGDVMGSYHPHGDAALYETLVRMAQPFSLRYPLVDGSGNFGSLDGDSAAAMRYTECRLARISDEMLDRDRAGDGPLPAELRRHEDRAGRAAGAPPEPARQRRDRHRRRHGDQHPAAQPRRGLHGARQAARQRGHRQRAAVPLRQGAGLPDRRADPQLAGGAESRSTRPARASIRLRGTWDIGPETRSTKTIYIDSIPYTVNKAQLVERIADVVLSRKLPPLLDVKDLSTEDVRIALEMKKDADEKMVMAYLFKHTPLQINFAVNLTCLIPTENPEVGRPERLDLKPILWHFLHFRLEVVTRRLEHELAALRKRIHILEGFEKVFDALDEIIRIIRKSDGKADAAEKIMKRFELDAEQTDAILELKIYRLARLEILVIRNELEEKRKRARQIGALLKDEDSRWKLVRDELEEIQKTYGDAKVDKRRTLIESDAGEAEYTADDFIVEEDNVVIVSRDGWVKRQKEVKDLVDDAAARGRRGARGVRRQHARDLRVLHATSASPTPCRIIDVPASTGYGEPIQRLFKLKDGEKIVAALSLDPRAIGDVKPSAKQPDAAAARARASPSRATATACASASSRSSSRARAPAAGTRGRPKAPRSSASRGSPAARC